MGEVLRGVVGATFQESVIVTDSAGAPVDLTAADIVWTAKARIDDADVDAVLSASVAGGTITIVSAPDGTIVFAIPAATMGAVEPRYARNRHDHYVWTIEVSAAGVVTRYPGGVDGGLGKLLVWPSAVVAVPT